MCTKNLFKITSFLQVDENGRPKQWFLNSPSYIEAQKYKPPHYSMQKIPCGQCFECNMEYAKPWAFRCMCEAKKYENNIMINLTYDDENVPKGQKIDLKTGEVRESLTLKRKDQQDFIKRLRKHFSEQKIKIYLCGEYGSQTKRPHYHILAFNLKIDDLKEIGRKNTEYGQHIIYNSKTIEKIWGKGFVDLNEVNYETSCYVAGYVAKKAKHKKSDEWWEQQGKIPEYTVSSKNFGKDYFEKNKDKFYEEKKIWQKTKKGLQEIKPGRYFDKLMEKDNPERFKQLKKLRRERSKDILENILNKTSLNKDEYMERKTIINENKRKKMKRAFK